MKEIKLTDIELINVVILILGSIVTIVIMRDFKHVFSFAVASAIMTLNFRLLRKIIEDGFLKSTINKKDLFIKLPLKFLALIALVVIIIIYGDIDVTFFLIGLSTVFLSIIINQVSIFFRPATKRSQNNGT